MQTIKKRIILLVAILLWSCVSVFAGEVRVVHFLKDSYASGERTVKSSGENAAMFVNAEFAGGTTNTGKFSLYVSPYLVANQGGRYTKHIYIGSQRIVSKLGDLKSYGADPRRIEYAGSESDGPKVDYKTKYALQQQVIKDNFAHFDVPYNGADNNDYVDGKGFSEKDGSLKSAMLKAASLKDNFQQGDSYEQYQYFYHPDHLGSSSFITNTEGEIVQHIEYVPYGEVFIEERNNVWNTPYLFNAKEFDEETGLYYYGARYYDSRLAMWYGVDALAEKYPNMGGYVYCANNPVKFVDPDGRKIVLPKGTSTSNIYLVLGNLQKLTNDKLVYSTQKDGSIRIKIASLGKGNKPAGTNLIRRLNSSAKTLTIDIQNSQGKFSNGTGNKAKAYNFTKATNGEGSDAIVSFDPSSNPYIKTKDPKTGNVSGKTRPNHIGLGHELIHAEHYMDGDYTPATSTSHSYKDASGNLVTKTCKTEELRTVGISGNKKDDITENQLRKEQNLNPRGAY